MSEKIVKTESEWMEQLTPEEFYVTRQKGTERAFTGEFHNAKTPGIYTCTCCGQDLFTSDEKFDSGTGWPSYWRPLSEEAVITEDDSSFGMVRTEVMCSKCDSHLGHVFPDGPPPTGQRYCINSVSLKIRDKD